MKAIILAAGRGSRMKGLTECRPKCLVEVRGRSLLDWQIEALRSAGIEEIAIVTGYKREMLVRGDIVEFHNPRWAETNMVSSLECADGWLESGPCIVSYSDILYDAEPVRSLIDSPAFLAVAYDPNWLAKWTKRFGDPLLDAETFRKSRDGYLLEIGKPPDSVDEVQGQYMGLLRFTPAGWSMVKRIRSTLTVDERDRMHMTGTLQMLIETTELAIAAIPNVGDWAEFDSAADIDAYLDLRG